MRSSEGNLRRTVYRPIQQSSGFTTHFRNMMADFGKANSLGFRLALRNISARYRQSFIGIVWIFIPPIMTSAIWIFLFSSKIVNLSLPDMPFPVFVVCGTVIWQIFTTSVLSPGQMVVQNKSLLVKINFPRESIFICGFYEILFNSIITSIVALVAVLIMGVVPDWSILLYFPFMLVLVLSGLMIGLFLLPFSVLLKDIQMAIPIFLQFLMYLSPVVFPSLKIGGIDIVGDINPLSYPIQFLRATLTGGNIWESFLPLCIFSAITILLVVLAFVFVRVTMEILVERMGA